MNSIVTILMRKLRICYLLILTVLIVIMNTSCEDDLLTGQLVGFIVLRDNYNNPLSDMSGVEVIADNGISISSVFSDEDGYYTFNDLESGTYNISFRKVGFGEYMIPGFTFVGGSAPAAIRYIYIHELVEGEIQNLSISESLSGVDLNDGVYVQVTGSMIAGEERIPRSLRCYLSNSSDVSYNNYLSTEPIDLDFGSDDIYFVFEVDTLCYPVGSDLYMSIYPQTNSSSYVNPLDGTKIYYNVNTSCPSDVVHITVSKQE